MWIRTQRNELINLDKTIYLSITKVNHGDMNRRYINVFYWNDDKNILATYATEQRALEVLDEIQECIDLGYVSVKVPNMRTQNRQVYVMPVE